MAVSHNYLPGQYTETGKLEINHNYLPRQFADYRDILAKIGELVQSGDYTLGRSVDLFEENITRITGSRFAVGTGSGTDALHLSLKAAGIGEGDEVITTPYTFYATVGAIVTAGARPVFTDIGGDYNMDPDGVEGAITEKTRAIVPVHWAGLPCDMDRIMEIAGRRGLAVVEDACHAIQALYRGKHAGTFGLTGCFSMHPLKNLNVWGDGGFVVTDSEAVHDWMVLLRNHGLVNRDRCEVFAYNSRLDSIQAVVANHMLAKLDHITHKRRENAFRLDDLLSGIAQVTVPERPAHVHQVFHLYVIRVEARDRLQQYLIQNGIDAKVHYPVPMHLQPAAAYLGHRRGDFPVCEAVCDTVLSLPVHEYITAEQTAFMAGKIKEFYARG